MNAVIKNPFERKQEGRVTVLNSNFLKLALAVSVMFMLEACAKEPAEPAVITMTTEASQVAFYVTGSKDISIDWGDGKKSNVNDAIFDELSEQFWFSHEYSGTTAHDIIITDNVTRLNCSNNQLTVLDVSRSTALTYLLCSRNSLTNLDVSKNAVLNHLDCNHNQIKSLDVSKNTALITLHIVGNQFAAAALNDLFSSLPDNTKTNYARVILIAGSISGNPGNLECDRSIAEKKGWGFMVDRHE